MLQGLLRFTAHVLIQQINCRLMRNDAVRDGISLLLVVIALAADAVLQAHSTALLHHVRSFVCGEMQIGLGFEADTITHGKGACAHILRGLLRGPALLTP